MFRSRKDDSAVTGTDCSCRGSSFDFLRSCLLAHRACHSSSRKMDTCDLRAPAFMCTNAPTHLKNLQRKDDVCFTALEAGSPHNTVSGLWEYHDERRGRPVWSQTQALTTTCCKSSGTRRAVLVLATSSSLNDPRTPNRVTSLKGSTTLRPRSHL